MEFNLYNIQCKEDEVTIEALLFIGLQQKISKCYMKLENDNEVIYSKIQEGSDIHFNNKDSKVNKIIFPKVKLNLGNYIFFAEVDNEVYELNFKDNKSCEIVNSKNKYNIFTKKRILEINKNSIKVFKRKIFSKTKYEIEKIKYSLLELKKIPIYRIFKSVPKYYLFNDRMNIADDNAIALFEYINKNQKEIAKYSYFVLDKNSKDIEKVKKIGKVLINESINHKIKYINCKVVISSFTSYYDKFFNPFNFQEMQMYKDICNKRFVFLQHGVIINDVSKYLNRGFSIVDKFITTTIDERKSVCNNSYLYDENDIVLTGLARYDKLYIKNKLNATKKVIFIIPTWRDYVMDISNDEFEKTEYFEKYSKLLGDKKLINTLEKKGYIIKFMLHPNIIKYTNVFERLNKKNIKIINASNCEYSDLFTECSMMITDYSSIHHDVAYLKKTILYYQFDKEKFHYKSGYFDYEKDGFGPIYTEHEELVNKIISYMNNPKCEEKYLEIMEKTFLNCDSNNCKRIVEHIENIDFNIKSYVFNNTF